MRKIFIILLIILVLGVCGIFISKKNLPEETGYFVFPVSVGIASSIVSGTVLLYILHITGKKKSIERKEVLVPVKELEAILYEIRIVEESKKKLENKVYRLTKRVLPYLSTIVKDYGEFLHQLTEDYRDSIYTVYFSLTGKHGHYAPQRLLYDVRKLKEAIYGILGESE